MTVGAPLEGVCPVHEDLGLHDGHEPGLLGQRGVPGQRVRVGLDAGGRWRVGADADDGAPLGEAGAEGGVLDEALPETVEPLGDQLAR